MKKLQVHLSSVLILTLIFNCTLHAQINDTIEFPWQFISYPFIEDTTVTSYPEADEGSDLLEKTLWIRNDLEGTKPSDIVYVNDTINAQGIHKIYVYGEHKLLVIDEQTKEITNSIFISDYGSQTLRKHESVLKTSRETHLAYNRKFNELYCLTEDLKVLIINPAIDQVTGTISLPVNHPKPVGWAMIKHNPLTDQIYVLLSYIPHSKYLQWLRRQAKFRLLCLKTQYL